jgi:hypothetical protein
MNTRTTTLLAAMLLALTACASNTNNATPSAFNSSNGYNAAGYHAIEKHNRIYLFIPGSEAEKSFNATGEMARSVTRIGKGPNGMTIVADPDVNVDKYLQALGVGTAKKE